MILNREHFVWCLNEFIHYSHEILYRNLFVWGLYCFILNHNYGSMNLSSFGDLFRLVFNLEKIRSRCCLVFDEQYCRDATLVRLENRSEERRVGKECRSRWARAV